MVPPSGSVARNVRCNIPADALYRLLPRFQANPKTVELSRVHVRTYIPRAASATAPHTLPPTSNLWKPRQNLWNNHLPRGITTPVVVVVVVVVVSGSGAFAIYSRYILRIFAQNFPSALSLPPPSSLHHLSPRIFQYQFTVISLR